MSTRTAATVTKSNYKDMNKKLDSILERLPQKP